MKTFIANSAFIFFSILMISSCKEEGPYINFTPPAAFIDTNYLDTNIPAAEAKNVLIEDFTGVRCPNCPSAQAEAKKLAVANPGRVNLVTIHPLGLLSSLTTPFSKGKGDSYDSKYDFRTQAGTEIFKLIGVTQSLPRGSVNRKLFGSETERAIDYAKWSAYVNSELAANSPVKIELSASVNNKREITIDLFLRYTEMQSDSQYLSLMLTESNLIDIQEKNDGGNIVYDEQYHHDHVLRQVATNFLGDYLNASLIPGRVFQKRFKILANESWNLNELHVIALVHKSTSAKDVIHSKESKVN